jgi:hypothetical protein
MKRKLIKFDAFRRIENDSLSSAEIELTEASEVLATALAVDGLNLHCFGESDVTYETSDGDYVHANYSLQKNHLVFENIEQLVIDNESERAEARNILSGIVESLMDENENKAASLFDQYMALPHTRQNLKEATLNEGKSKTSKSNPTGKHGHGFGKHQPEHVVKARMLSRKRTLNSMSDAEKKRRNREVVLQRNGHERGFSFLANTTTLTTAANSKKDVSSNGSTYFAKSVRPTASVVPCTPAWARGPGMERMMEKICQNTRPLRATAASGEKPKPRQSSESLR